MKKEKKVILQTEVMRNRIKFWTDREIRAAFDKRGGQI